MKESRGSGSSRAAARDCDACCDYVNVMAIKIWRRVSTSFLIHHTHHDAVLAQPTLVHAATAQTTQTVVTQISFLPRPHFLFLLLLPYSSMTSLLTSTRLSRAADCLAWCSQRRKDIPASSSKDACPYSFLESVTPFDHGVFDWGIGLKAARSVAKNEQFCSLPTRWAWSGLSCNTDPIIGSLLRKFQGKIRTDDLIAIKLALHKHLGNESPWFEHIQVLPTTYDSVLFWSKEELLELEGTNTYQLAVALQQQVHADYQELMGYMMHQDKEVADASNSKENGWMMFFTIENYMWALGTLYSRGHDFVRGKGNNEQFRCMLPGIDFLNMATSEKEANVEVRLVGNRVDLVALKECTEGEELRVIYNKDLPNNRLLHLHGFVVTPNPLSYVPLYCELSPDAPMYKAKMTALKGIFKAGTFFKLQLNDPIPDTLLYTLAVQRASSPNELRSMVDGEGGGGNREMILRELVLALTQMLAGYKTTESVDQEILEEQKNEHEQVTSVLSVTKRRLRLATRLRYDEKQILRKGMSVLMDMLSGCRGNASSSEDSDSSESEDGVGDIDA